MIMMDVNIDRKDIYKYINKTLNELNELGFKDLDKTLKAIKEILNVNSIINYIDIGMDKTKKKKDRKSIYENIAEGWKCNKCTLINYKEFKKCAACNHPQKN